MRHSHAGRKLGVGSPQRTALLRSLTLAIIERPAITTTVARAKELRWFADRVVTLAKRNDVAGRRQIVKLLGNTQTYRTGENRVRNAIERLYGEIVPRYRDRQGGYTQLVRLAENRAGDNSSMCMIRYIPGKEEAAPKAKKAAKATKQAAPKAAKEAKADKADKKAVAKKAKAKASDKA